VQELRQAAGSAGFIITNNHSKTPRSNLLAISGDDVADIIRRVLKKQCYGGEIEKIKDYDREGVGVYAILFDINNGQLLIYNKDMFLNKKP
jgi:3-hydroxy-3-methylglutaryl CoA synthase